MSVKDQIRPAVEGPLARLGLLVEDVAVMPAGRRRLVRVWIDRVLPDEAETTAPVAPLSLDEVADATRIWLPESEDGDYETLAGLVTERLGRVPRVGDAVELEARDEEGRIRPARLSVRRMDALRVDRVRLEVGEPQAAAEDEEG